MKIPVIKRLVEHYTSEQLEQAKQALLDERQPEIPIEGEDDGEQLTNVMAAIWVKEDMAIRAVDVINSIRAYSQKVRNSIN